MQTHHFTFGIALLLVTGFVGAAHAKTQHFHCKAGGTFADGVETNIDTNGDGASATLDQGLVICNTGKGFFQEEAEWIPQPTLTNCPAGMDLELHIDATHGQHRSVTTDEKTGDQLFAQLLSETECVQFSTGTFTGWGHGVFIGGTGKATDATGTYDSHFAGSYLQFGFKAGVFGGFGQFTATTDGTLILPKSEGYGNDED